MHKITFSKTANHGFGREFDILLDGVVIGTASKADCYASCEYCTTGLEYDGQYFDFTHEWGRNARTAQRDIAVQVRQLIQPL